MLPEIATEELAATLDRQVAELLSVHGVFSPPVDALQLAGKLGLDVAWDGSQAGRARIVRLRPSQNRQARHAVLLRPEPRPERIQWAVAHEIGESLAHCVFEALGMDPAGAPADARERLADALAVRLLLPTDWFAADAAACDWDLAALKVRFNTASHELIARRMLDFSQPAVITIFDQGKLHYRRANGGRVAGSLQPIEKTCRRLVHETGRAAERSDGACQVRGWPIHEPDWKREILRTQCLDEDAGWTE